MPTPTLSTDKTEGMTAKSRKGKPLITDEDITAEREALLERERINAEQSNQTMSNNYTAAAFNKNKVNETPTSLYVKPTRYGSPERIPTQQPKCEGSSCTISGGKRRKSRKQRGSRKSKKSRRR
jgi:hypothetical protein